MKPEDPGQQNPQDPEPHEPHEPHEPEVVQYFVPGQVVLHLEHPTGLTQQELAAALEGFIYKPSQEYPWKSRLAPPKAGSVLTFSFENSPGPAFSIVPVRLANGDASQDEQVRLLVEIFSQLRQGPVGITAGSGPTIVLKTVSPNWLVGGVSHQIGIGGPGDWPDKAAPSLNSWPKFHLPEAVTLQAVEPTGGAGVHVAILDTAPCLHDLDRAYEKWHAKGHPLIDSLLAPDGPLNVYPASYQDLRLVGDYSLLDHRYLMADHGLFVAGIIHTLAPQATLHLYEVLNPYGVGCVETIAQGLRNVLDNPRILRPLIVNCSLVLDLPAAGETFPDFPAPLADPATLEHMRAPLKQVMDLLAQTGAVFVAAAGNDAARSTGSSTGEGEPPGSGASSGSGGNAGGPPTRPSRPPARYPAAFPGVIGVGAVSEGTPTHGNPFQAASYSNLADDPPEIGFVTLGGESGRDQGMLGLFSGSYPNPADKGKPDPDDIGYLNNDSGWARWAGTSFATPIASGILAAWWDASLGVGATAAQTILDRAVSGATDQNEKVIQVEQV